MEKKYNSVKIECDGEMGMDEFISFLIGNLEFSRKVIGIRGDKKIILMQESRPESNFFTKICQKITDELKEGEKLSFIFNGIKISAENNYEGTPKTAKITEDRVKAALEIVKNHTKKQTHSCDGCYLIEECDHYDLTGLCK
jgi:hypothetical protein